MTPLYVHRLDHDQPGLVPTKHEDFKRLPNLIADAAYRKEFLNGVTGFAAAMITTSTGIRNDCAVALRRLKRTTTIVGSSDEAVEVGTRRSGGRLCGRYS
ncbi:hypothetical protein ACFRJ9_14505 [Paenarthrobacter sp. NPDC056912]|uniref:hypothetical protein n=1 Tax=Paenarthrobacter sp. NPDC056912 TaxID=3345965 RepID=UPI003672EDD3